MNNKLSLLFAAVLLFLLTAVLCACGIGARDNGSAPREDAAPLQESEQRTASVVELEQTPLFASALCAFHDGYKTGFTREDARAYLRENDPLGEAPEDPLDSYPAAFSESGRAMILKPCDQDSVTTDYEIYFTEDYGETWKMRSRKFYILGSVRGMITDGRDCWGYGFPGIANQGMLYHIPFGEDDEPKDLDINRFFDVLYVEYPFNVVCGFGWDADAQLLRVDVERRNTPSDTAHYRTMESCRFLLRRDLTLYSVEKTRFVEGTP